LLPLYCLVKAPYCAAGHQWCVSDLATAIAKKMTMNKNSVEGIRLGSIIHDIGKIYLQAETLSKSS